jgi:hypothetical protein
MGGRGSGFQGARKTTVEDGLTLSLSLMLERGALVPGAMTSGSWHWSYPGQEPHARIRYVGNMVDLDAATVTLDYRVNDQPMRYAVRLVSTVPRFGGRRWWFLCPLARRDGGPPRRVAKLHLPPGGRYFGSREAYGLTYRSNQENGAHRALFRRLAAQMGSDEASIRRALRRKVA